MNNEALAHNVRGWVHYDNMANTLQKQVTNARKQRDSYEEQIGGLLKQHQMPNAVIQISGGQLQLQEEKVTPGLTMKALQESTISFFKARPELPNPEKMAAEFLQHIKLQRGGASTTTLRLKKLKGPAPV
uniref:Uncharacterized protein n=1 Tax=viral metagenome TaxID=1070528 RepID=A0A6C0APJ7_9ZZZZ